ncbi:hypothetical protein AB0K74_48790, partial [Streptomyces sp. NPDC056159]
QPSVLEAVEGILANRPECYLYSPVLGCVITGLPRQDITHHYSARQALRLVHEDRGLAGPHKVSTELLTLVDHIVDAGHTDRRVRTRGGVAMFWLGGLGRCVVVGR